MSDREHNKKRFGIRAKHRLVALVCYLFAGFTAVIILAPMIWMVSTAFKSDGEVFLAGRNFFASWMPMEWHPENLLKALSYADYQLPRGFVNTMIITIPTVAVGIFCSSIGGYAFAKIRFPGRDKIFFALICFMMIPGVITMLPSFILFSKLHWVDTYLPLMIPPMLGSITGVFFLRQFFTGVPDELLESARIDGCSEFKVFCSIAVPCAKPAIATQAVLGFMACYNDFTNPLIYINSPEKFTLQLALSNLGGFYFVSWPLIMSGACLALIPSVVIFFAAQKYFVEGIATTGLKV